MVASGCAATLHECEQDVFRRVMDGLVLIRDHLLHHNHAYALAKHAGRHLPNLADVLHPVAVRPTEV